jgi:hypothetical protein
VAEHGRRSSGETERAHEFVGLHGIVASDELRQPTRCKLALVFHLPEPQPRRDVPLPEKQVRLRCCAHVHHAVVLLRGKFTSAPAGS